MNKYADISWSKKLGKYFQDAEWWFVDSIYYNTPSILHKNNTNVKDKHPAITTDMVIEWLPVGTVIFKTTKSYRVGIPRFKNYKFDDKKIVHACLKMFEWLIDNGHVEKIK